MPTVNAGETVVTTEQWEALEKELLDLRASKARLQLALQSAENSQPRMSASTALLMGALAKAQGEFKPLEKDCINTHFQSRYASLNACLAAVREALSSNKLAVVQIPGSKTGSVNVETFIFHESGQWISGVFWMPAEKLTAHGFGSALTYCRRYALCSMLGLAAEEDDDGNLAMKGNTSSTTPVGGKYVPPRQQREKDEPKLKLTPEQSAMAAAAFGAGGRK
jgi:hypothetical protein